MGVTFTFREESNEGLGAVDDKLTDLIGGKRIPQPDGQDEVFGGRPRSMFFYRDDNVAAMAAKVFIREGLVFSVSYGDTPNKADG